MRKKPASAKKYRITTEQLFTTTFRYKDPCYGALTEESRKRAAEAQIHGTLPLLDGLLLCEWGQRVAARESKEGSPLKPWPRPHERYRKPPRTTGKRGFEKRI